VRSGVLVQERCCPACAATVRVRDARWCGTCGELLEPVAVEAPAPTGSPWRRRLLFGTAGAAVLAVAVVTGGGVIDRTAARSAAVQDLAVATPDADVLDGLEPAPRPAPPVVEEPTCTRTGDRACFLWTAEAGDSVGFTVAAIAGAMVVTYDGSNRTLAARDLRDGTVVWSVRTPEGGWSDSTLLTAGDLLLNVEGDDLVARELTTGVERWRTAELGGVTPWQVHPAGDALVVIGEDHRVLSAGETETGSVAAALDPVTGSVLWHRAGSSASLAAGGVIVMTADGELATYAPTGELRWRTAEPFEDRVAGGAWAHGHVISVYDEITGASELHRLLDGAPLGFDGYPIATDDGHTLVQLHGNAADDGAIVLLDEEGEVWRLEGADWSECVGPTRFTATTVALTSCGGDTVTLDRADGSVLDRTPGPDAEVLPLVGHRERVGPYELRSSETEGSVHDVVVTRAATDTELARLPPDTWPVWSQDPGGSPEFGDALVLQSRGWLTALPLPRPSVVGGARTQ
jgi:outer membrane protein assembly factor BamB